MALPPASFNVQTLLPPPQLSPNDQKLDTTEQNNNLYNPNSTNPANDVFPLQFNGGAAGINPQVVVDGQQVMFPLDNTLTLAQLEALSVTPTGFALTPTQLDANTFEQFSSAFQVAYIQKNPDAGSKPAATPPLLFATIGGGINPTTGQPAAGPVHALVSADKTKVYVIENLTKNDITKMSTADVALLQQVATNTGAGGSLGAFAAVVSTQLATLGLSIDPPATAATKIGADKQSALNAIASFFSLTQSNTGSTPPVAVTISDTLVNLPAPPSGLTTSNMSAADRAVFVKEAQILANSIVNNPIISAKDVSDQLKLITDRLKQVAAFSGERIFLTTAAEGQPAQSSTGYIAGWLGDSVTFIPDPRVDPAVNPSPALVPVNVTINNGYVNMMNQEKQIANLANAAYQQSTGLDLAGHTVARPQNLDAPALIFQFQLNANLTQEAEIAISTEVVKQLNALLTTYNNMQQMVNATLARFTATNDAQADAQATQPLFNSTGGNIINLPTPTAGATNPANLFDSVATMFSQTLPRNTHPLEALFGIARPVATLVQNNDVTDGNGKKIKGVVTGGYIGLQKSQWTSFNDQLSAAVTQLNQQSQILTNSIDSLTKQKDRHFDLGNNALSKMADMIQTIGRNIS